MMEGRESLKRSFIDLSSDNEDDNANILKPPPPQADRKGDIDKELEHVFNVIQISSVHLKNLGITTVGDLLKRRDDFEQRKIPSLRRGLQEDLYHFCLWYHDFLLAHGLDANLTEHFTAKVFDDFVEARDKTPVEKPEGERTATVFRHARRMLHEGDPGDLSNLSCDQLDTLFSHVVKQVIDDLNADFLSNCHFDVRELIKICTKALFNLPSGDPYDKVLLIAGCTQAGKSYVKGVIRKTCELLKCYHIIITKGVSESKDLEAKLNRLLDNGHSAYDSWWNGNKKCPSKVVADTAAQLNKNGIAEVKTMRSISPHGKFCVIVDECDAFYRTEDKKQVFEREYHRLMAMKPALRIEISATPIPALLVLADDGHQVEIFELGTSKDYCGVSQMKPLQNENGNNLYLKVKKKSEFNDGIPYAGLDKQFYMQDDNEALFPNANNNKLKESQANDFETSEDLQNIPYTDETVMRLYDDCMSGTGERVLALDCTNNKVRADNNVFQKAACIQNHFFLQNKRMVVICVVGNGIYFRRPGFLHGRKVNNFKTVSDVIEQLDKEFGPAMPFLVFGYAKMRRSISFRSGNRVPTHMVLFLGLGQSNENYIQAIGRATFNGLESVLKKNGFSHVTILTAQSDFRMAQKYYSFVHEVAEYLKKDNANKEKLPILEFLERGKERFKDMSNYLRHTNRKTGQIKTLKDKLPSQERFEDPILLDDDDDEDEIYGGNEEIGPRVMRAVYDLVHETRPKKNYSNSAGGNETDAIELLDSDDENEDDEEDEAIFKTINERGFSMEQVMKKYNDSYQTNNYDTIKKTALSQELSLLVSAAKLEKIPEGRFRAKNWAAFKMDVQKWEKQQKAQVGVLGASLRAEPSS